MKGFLFFVSFIVFTSLCQASRLNDYRGSRETRNMGLSDEHDDDDHMRMPKKLGSGSGSILGSFHPGLEPLITHTGIGIGDHHVLGQGQCEPIKISLCMEVGYNQTTMPNLVGHDAQADADALLQTFTPLIQYGCSPHLKLFLCSAHAPMCTDKVPQPIGPCRSLCESVRGKCEPVLTEFGFKWPPPLECSKFHPMNNHEHMCIPGPMDPNHSMLGFGGSSGPNPSRDRDLPPSTKGNKDTSPVVFRGQVPTLPQRGLSVDHPKSGHEFHLPDYPKFPVNNPNTGLGIVPRVPQVNMKETPNSSSNQCVGPRRFWTKGACWIKCGVSGGSGSDSGSGVVSQLFTESEKTFARNYALPWAILSLSTALIAFLLSLGSPRLSTAERPIIYIAVCQIMYSTGVILGTTMSLSCFLDKSSGMELLAGKGTVPSPCAVVFLLTYFFGTASTLWWVVLCLSWMLSLNRKLCQSLEQKEWSLFYLLTWGLASVLTSAALIHKKVDADELTGLCGVGFQDLEALTYYQMVPLNASLSLGLLFLLSGLMYRLFPTWNTFLCNLGLSRVKASVGSVNNGTGGARHNLAYSPVLVLPPPPTHCPSYDPHSNSASAFTGSANNSSTGLQRTRALEISKAVWMRIGIFSLVHILPLACQIGTMAYELSSREDWEAGRSRPTIQVFLLRLNMNLWSGITTVVWVLSTYSWKTLSDLLCPCALLGNKIDADSKSSSISTSTRPPHTTPTSPLLVPVPCNSSATSFITSAHSLARQQPYNSNLGNNGIRQNFAGILPRCHNHPLPPLPARNNPEQRTDAWRRGETIV